MLAVARRQLRTPCRDAFGRLVTVKNQSNATVAEYKYNGLGYRTGWHYDVTNAGGSAPDGTVDSNDPWYSFGYDERWRVVATYRGSDCPAPLNPAQPQVP